MSIAGSTDAGLGMKSYLNRSDFILARAVTCAIVAAVALAPPAAAQVQVQGIVQPRGVIKPSGYTGLNQYTHIWAFQPPLSPMSDNSYFTSNVLMNNPSIDGVSLTLSWSSVETSQPTTTPCVPSDQCQRDPGSPQMYHTYSWSTYDSHTSDSPVYQWFQYPPKKVNLLIAGESAAATNGTTPWYVTSAWWYDQFNPQQQDVLNLMNASCGTLPWTGTPVPSMGMGSITYSAGPPVTITVNSNNCCSATNQAATIQDGDTIWVTAGSCGTSSTGVQATVSMGSTGTFSYTPNAGSCTAAPSSLTFISASESWAVPYEYPYMSALQAFWAAVVAHYGPGFTLNGNSYFSQLNYFRFGGSVGSEWYPYCTPSLPSNPPYTYMPSTWTNYYQNMGNYLQSLGPPWRIIHSINSAETSPVNYTYATTEAGDAIQWSNAFGVRDGFGSQGLSALDSVACSSGMCTSNCTYVPPDTNCSASNWFPLFYNNKSLGIPLELQPASLSYPGDVNCTSPTCGTGTGKYSGDLPTYLNPFAIAQGTTDVEIYWRDLSLAYDATNYCDLNTAVPPNGCQPTYSISPGGEIVSPGTQFIFFQGTTTPFTQGVGTGDTYPYCTVLPPPQTTAIGNCNYSNNISAAHGQH
jgi:hypothetical protein